MSQGIPRLGAAFASTSLGMTNQKLLGMTRTAAAAKTICLQLSLALLSARHCSVELPRLVLRHRDGLPVRQLVVLAKEDDLADVVRVVRDLAVDGLHHGVRFAADGDLALEVRVRERRERLENE